MGLCNEGFDCHLLILSTENMLSFTTAGSYGFILYRLVLNHQW